MVADHLWEGDQDGAVLMLDEASQITGKREWISGNGDTAWDDDDTPLCLKQPDDGRTKRNTHPMVMMTMIVMIHLVPRLISRSCLVAPSSHLTTMAVSKRGAARS
jgi:hypothetical protein